MQHCNWEMDASPIYSNSNPVLYNLADSDYDCRFHDFDSVLNLRLKKPRTDLGNGFRCRVSVLYLTPLAKWCLDSTCWKIHAHLKHRWNSSTANRIEQ